MKVHLTIPIHLKPTFDNIIITGVYDTGSNITLFNSKLLYNIRDYLQLNDCLR